jgi:hypothetical protein
MGIVSLHPSYVCKIVVIYFKLTACYWHFSAGHLRHLVG